MASAHDVEDSLRDTAQALADSGTCEDCWDIEMALVGRGYAPAAARRITADEALRATLDQRCVDALRRRA